MKNKKVNIAMKLSYKTIEEIKFDLSNTHLTEFLTYIIIRSWFNVIFQATCKDDK